MPVRNQDVEQMQTCDLEFHMLLIDSCKNIFLYSDLKAFTVFLKNPSWRMSERKPSIQRHPLYHQRILDCIVNKDYNTVHEVVAESLATWRERRLNRG